MIHVFFWDENDDLHGYGAWTTRRGTIYRVFGYATAADARREVRWMARP